MCITTTHCHFRNHINVLSTKAINYEHARFNPKKSKIAAQNRSLIGANNPNGIIKY